MALKTALEQIKDLGGQINDVLRVSTYEEYADLRGLHVDCKDSEQLFLLKELRSILWKLADAAGSIEYLSRPVKETGFLHRNADGEYQTGKGYLYRSGSLIEFLAQEDTSGVPCWTVGKVEHDGEDYYLMGYEDIPLDGLHVRVR
jgi:hypothetical protein